MPSWLSFAYDHSTYVMPPSVDFTPSDTPADFSRPSPTVPAHFLAGSVCQAEGAAPARYFSKFSVVPDSSERKNTLMAVLGSLTPELTLAIAGSFQVLILPRKMFATTSGVSTSLSTPGTLYATAIGPAAIGRFHAGLPWQRFAAAATSPLSAFSAESEPAKSTWPALNCWMPAPEPVGL